MEWRGGRLRRWLVHPVNREGQGQAWDTLGYPYRPFAHNRTTDDPTRADHGASRKGIVCRAWPRVRSAERYALDAWVVCNNIIRVGLTTGCTRRIVWEWNGKGMTMKYLVEQCNKGERTIWVIKMKRTGKVLSHHVDSGEAHRTVQRYIEEDRDLAHW